MLSYKKKVMEHIFMSQYEGNNAIYHSINDCENITSFDIDVYNTDKTPSFCAKCMDDSLVSKCKVKIEQIKEIKEKDQQAKIEEANKYLTLNGIQTKKQDFRLNIRLL
jgi:hypothetical protein